MSQDETPTEATSKKRIALFGTMATNWRATITSMIHDHKFEVIDNTNPAWRGARTFVEIVPLLNEDIRIMREAHAIIWHFDAAGGKTASIEYGYLALLGKPIVVHVDEGADGREYMHALAILHPETLNWADSLGEAAFLAMVLAQVS